MVTEIDERGRCFLSCIVLVQLLPESDSRVHIMNKKKKVQVSTDGKDTHGPSAKHAPKARAQWKGKRGEQGKMEASMNDAGKELQKEQAAQQSPKTNAKDLAGSTHRGSPLCSTSPNEVSISSVLPHQGRSSDACLLPLSQVRSSEPSSISLMKTCEPCDIIVTPQGTHQLDLPVRGEEAAETMMVLQFQDQSKHCLGKGAKETFQDSSSAMNLGSLNGIKETEAENRHPVANSSVPGEPHEQALSALDQVTVEGQSVVSSKTNIPGSLVGRKLPFSDCTIDATSISSQTMLEISLSDSIPKAKELGLFESGQELVPGNNLQGKGSQDLEKREFRAQKERGLKRNNHNNSTTCSEARPQDTACPSARVLEDPSKEPSELFYLVVPAVTDSESPRQSLLTHVSEPVIPAEGKTTSQGSDVALLCSDVFHPVCTPTDNLTLDLREENELLCFTVAPLFPACANEVTLTSGAEAKESNMSEKGSEPEKTAVTMCGPLLEMMGKPVVSLEKGAQASVICPSSPEVQIKDVDRGNGAQQTCEPNWKVGVNSNLANPGQSEDTNCGMTMKPPDTGTHTESSLTCASVPNNKSPVFSSQSCSPCLEFQTRDHRNLPGSQMKRPLDEDRLEPAVPQLLVEHAAHSCPISADKGSKRSKPTLPLTNDSLTTYWLSDKQIGEENIWCIPSTVEEHKEEVPCCPPAAVEQDGTQTVQGLIAELSNLNRLIMNTHKDLETIRRQRHRRGRPGTKYLQRAGFMAKRGKEP